MLRTYPSLTEETVLWDMDGAKGWMMYHWAVTEAAAAAGVEMLIVGQGYIQQEKALIKAKSS